TDRYLRRSVPAAGHSDRVIAIVWAPCGNLLASASDDRTVRVWKHHQGLLLPELTLESGHTKTVTSVSFSADGRLLASKGMDGAVCLWSCATWKPVARLVESASIFWPPGLEFHPGEPTLATLGLRDREIRIWDIDTDLLLGEKTTVSMHVTPSSVHYA